MIPNMTLHYRLHKAVYWGIQDIVSEVAAQDQALSMDVFWPVHRAVHAATPDIWGGGNARWRITLSDTDVRGTP